ncbi:hypothetical protein AMATHDRAFT_49737 [Amanita thiersii Skay4041]|uniref:Uncharacterized protein n=1 Tax=Amanita thiersii Skay4041 TaxID=703135 RepID=A0A2A9NIT8_9AGAR|nr:hypothetical protein AMATHDRAFT_49737 [Amanita thiersii Skay4041]
MEVDAIPPIERCPQEILENIFIECLPPVHEPDRSFIPLRLSHVCSWWRTIAFNLPPLWRSLYLADNLKKRSKYEIFCPDKKRSIDSAAADNMKHLTKLWADNARHRSLSVYLEMNSFCHGAGNIVTNVANRLQFLRLQVLPSYIFEPFINTADIEVEQLESLHLTWNYSSAIMFNNVTAFTAAPKLHKLRLDFESIIDTIDNQMLEPSFTSYHFMVPWQQLTHVCMDNITLETWDDLLRSCPQLQECLVTFGNFADVTSSPLMLAQAPTTIRRLTKLGINLGRSGGLFSFDQLEMPALQSLQISAKPWMRNERARKFDWQDSLVPSFKWLGNLESLTVSLQDMSTRIDDLIKVLPYMKGLKNLTILYIENGSDVDTILRSLTHDSIPSTCPEDWVLPNLECLKLEMASTYDLRPATETLPCSIYNFVRHRWWKPVDSEDPGMSRRFASHRHLRSCNIGMTFFRKRGARKFFREVDQLLTPFRVQGLHAQIYESHCNWTYDRMTHDWW